MSELAQQVWHRVVFRETAEGGHSANDQRVSLLGDGVEPKRLKVHHCLRLILRDPVENGSASHRDALDIGAGARRAKSLSKRGRPVVFADDHCDRVPSMGADRLDPRLGAESYSSPGTT